MTGVFALAYAMPLAKLYITGKGVDKANELSGAEVAAVIEDGRDFSNWHHKDAYDGRTEARLIECLASWSPVVRYRAAESLSRKKGDFVAQLVKMLGSDDLNARYGACQALEFLRDRAAPVTGELTKLLAHNDQWLRIRASYALAGIGKAARGAAPDMLRLSLVEDKTDPREMMRRCLCLSLFLGGYADNAPRRGLLADSIDGIDRQGGSVFQARSGDSKGKWQSSIRTPRLFFFSHVARACQGMLFDTLDTVIRLMRKASTTTALCTTVNVIRRVYETGRQVADNLKATTTIRFDDLLPKWNHVAIPRQQRSWRSSVIKIRRTPAPARSIVGHIRRPKPSSAGRYSNAARLMECRVRTAAAKVTHRREQRLRRPLGSSRSAVKRCLAGGACGQVSTSSAQSQWRA